MEPHRGDWMEGCAEGYAGWMLDFFAGDDEQEMLVAPLAGIEHTNGAP